MTNAKIDSVDLTGCRNQSEQVKALVDHMAKISFMEPISDEDFANLSEEGELEAATSLNTFHEIIPDQHRHQDWPKGTLHASYAHVAYMGTGRF
jgi:hypothetical protein